jgi:hypothetical protein
MGEGPAMESLIIEATKSTPRVFFDPEANLLQISGESYPEHAAMFYTPIFTWLEAYLATPGRKRITVDLEILYFNSSSSKALMNFFERLEGAAAAGHQVLVKWRYRLGDEIALECGEELREDAPSLNFDFIPMSPYPEG